MKHNLQTFPELHTPSSRNDCHAEIWKYHKWRQDFEKELQQLKQKYAETEEYSEDEIFILHRCIDEILGVKQESQLVADNNPNDFGWHTSDYEKKGPKP